MGRAGERFRWCEVDCGNRAASVEHGQEDDLSTAPPVNSGIQAAVRSHRQCGLGRSSADWRGAANVGEHPLDVRERNRSRELWCEPTVDAVGITSTRECRNRATLDKDALLRLLVRGRSGCGDGDRAEDADDD